MMTTPNQQSGTSSTDLGGTNDPRDITLPFYGVKPFIALQRFFRQYTKFSGRASRSEYWWAQLFVGIIMVIPSLLFAFGMVGAAAWSAENQQETSMGYAGGEDIVVQQNPGIVNAPTAAIMFIGLGLMFVVGLALILPQLALVVRRLHDANFTGWLALVYIIPALGALAIFILALMPSNPMGRRYDPDSVQVSTQPPAPTQE